MSSSMPRSAIGVLALIVVVLAGAGAYLAAPLGGPGTAAFVVRLLLVSLAFIVAHLLGIVLRSPYQAT
jgi:hypothetical protein